MSNHIMTDSRFWQLIDQARPETAASANPEKLLTVLEGLGTEEVKCFIRLYTFKLCELNNWKLWAVGHIVLGWMGDDSFHYFRSWIIGKGKVVYEFALDKPDDLASYIDDPKIDNEELEYVALDVLRSRGDISDPREDVGRFPDEPPSGEPLAEQEWPLLFPKTVARYMHT